MTTTHTLDYPQEDASEAEVLTYLESKCRQLAIEALRQPDGKLKPFNLKPRRDGQHKNVNEFFTRLPKELVYFHREEMNEWAEPDRIKDLEIGDVVDGPNSYEKSLTLTFTKTVRRGKTTQSSMKTETITIKSYKTPLTIITRACF